GIRDLTVTGVQTCALPISLDPRMLLVMGRTASRTLRRHTFEPHRYIVRWGAEGPRVILPADAVPFGYLLRVSRPHSVVRRLRNRLSHGLLGAGVPAHRLVPP